MLFTVGQKDKPKTMYYKHEWLYFKKGRFFFTVCYWNSNLQWQRRAELRTSIQWFDLHERDDGLILVVVCRRDVDKHEGLGIPSQWVLHEHGQLVVTVGDELLVTAQGWNDVPKGRQRLVDGHSFLSEFKLKYVL